MSRRRKKVNLTLDPRMEEMLAELATTLNVSRGRIVDKLILSLMACMKTGREHCTNGDICPYNVKFYPKDFLIG